MDWQRLCIEAQEKTQNPYKLRFRYIRKRRQYCRFVNDQL